MFKKYIYNFIILLIIFDISKSSIISSQWIEIGLTLIVLFLFLFEKKSFSLKIPFAIFFWFIINLGALIFLGNPFSIIRVAKLSVILLLFPYLTLKTIGISFWQKFEKIIYILTFISIPIYVLNLISPDFFNSLLSIFRPFTASKFHEYHYNSPYWSAFIYVNAIRDGSLLRNSGFMWEPGSFAMIIIWAIVYNWLSSGVIFNLKVSIYIIALASTFSTAGYLAFFVLLLSLFKRKMTMANILIICIIGLIFIFYILNLNFMTNKINTYLNIYKENPLQYDPFYKTIKVSRLQIAYYDLLEVLKYPMGYGYGDNTGIIGVNGLSALLKMWGIPIFLYFLWLLKEYLNLFNLQLFNMFTISIFFSGILIMLFSNPIDRSIFLYFILITPLIFKKYNVGNKMTT
jgi:hypothetical protein